MPRCPLHLVVGLVVGLLVPALIAPSWAQESARSWPKDTTPYERLPIADDYAPGGHAALPESAPRALNVIRIVDVVVNNTDPNLQNIDTFSDGETSIAVNPANPGQIVITAFSSSWGAGNAALWYSTDGGQTWTKEFTVPVPPGASGTTGCPCDQTVDYGQNNLLSGTFLADHVYSGTTTNPASSVAWGWRVSGGVTQRTDFNGSATNDDQPWLLVNRDPTTATQDDVYVAYDNFNVSPTEVRVSASIGANPPNFTKDSSSGTSSGAINPGHRLAKDPGNGVIYSLFQNCFSNCATLAANPKTIQYVLNRSTDAGTTWSLNGSSTGIVVAQADSTQPQPKFGTVNALLGGVLHGAVDPSTGDLYYVYGNRDASTGNNRLAIRRITNSGSNVVVGTEHFVTGQVQAAIPSVAITDHGVVGVFYYTYNGSVSGFPSFTAHLAVSADFGVTFTDQALLNFLSPATDNGNVRQRVLGDYMQTKAVGDCFYGSFTGNGVPFGRSVSNMDPIFYKVCMSAPPIATTNAASNLTKSFATLNGTVNPNGLATTAVFQWGTTTAYGNTTASQSLGSGMTAVGVSANLTGLAGNTTYHYRVVATNSDGPTTPGADVTFTTSTNTFADVLPANPYFSWIEALAAAGITGGCFTAPPQYCPDGQVSRAQMAVFLLKGKHGLAFAPPAATGMFSDVPVGDLYAPWIEQLARDGITQGCGATTYCPNDPVTRAQMAVFLLKAKHGGGYSPPAATGTFTDVPVSNPYAPWIEQLAREGITHGCGPTTYCPDDPVTRAQMAVFLVLTFALPH